MKEFNHKAKLSLEDFRKYDNDEDYEFAYGVVDFLSNKPNSHMHKYSEEVIKEYAPTVINKWVIAEYDNFTKDVTTHTKNQQIVGRVPEQEVKYRYDEDGYLIASVDVVISKLYATDIYEIFRSNNERAVSIEELVGFTKDTENLEDGIQEKEIEGFNITGITILGLSYRPSVPNANIKITQMSEIVNSMEQEYVKYSQNNKSNVDDNISIKDIMAKLDIIENKLSKKEETMAEEVKVVVDEEVELSNIDSEVQAEAQEDTTVVENACGDNKEKMEEDTSEDTSEDDKAEEQEEVDNACGDKVDNGCSEEVDNSVCEDTVDNSCEQKMAELEQKLQEANSTILKYEEELAELRTFKEKTQLAEKTAIVNETLANIKDYVDSEAYSRYEKSGNECEYSNINGWRNEALASIASKALAKMAQLTSKEEGITEIDIPSETKQKTSIFD